MGGARIPIAEDNVVQPVGDNAGGVHQLAYRLEDGFEVVLLGLAAHEDVKGGVDILRPLAGQVHVLPVLVAVQPHPAIRVRLHSLNPRKLILSLTTEISVTIENLWKKNVLNIFIAVEKCKKM